MWSTPFVAAARRASPALLALLASLPALYAQRPLKDQDVLQYLNQTVTWYRDIAGFVQSSADSQQLMFADSLRQSSTAAVRQKSATTMSWHIPPPG